MGGGGVGGGGEEMAGVGGGEEVELGWRLEVGERRWRGGVEVGERRWGRGDGGVGWRGGGGLEVGERRWRVWGAEADIIFRRLYICFKPLAEGFVNGCRQFIGLDGCFLKTEAKGQLLSAVGKDGNN